MWTDYFSPSTLPEALQLLAQHAPAARLLAGATDLMLEMERQQHPNLSALIDISRLPGLAHIRQDENGWLHIGALVTHNAAASSPLLQQFALPLAQAAWQVGSPQIRNRGTLGGNLVTASPANDTITPLMALEARLVLRSLRGERTVPLAQFYTGVRRTVLQPDEMLTEIQCRAMPPEERGIFLKLALRRAQAISLVNLALLLRLKGDSVEQAVLTLGAVSPVILRATQVEQFLIGKRLTEETLAAAADLASQAAAPISDVRATADYRRYACGALTRRGLEMLLRNENPLPARPVLLAGPNPAWEGQTLSAAGAAPLSSIQTRINGTEYRFDNLAPQSLLSLLRNAAGLTGSKEGCAEGECGACTVYLDGKAVMACLVPAPRAHGAEIVTVEGLAGEGALHPVQQAFVEGGAVQCGYCTPGFVMSAAKLLEENRRPQKNEIEAALTGNLCRCTGYYGIMQAVEAASQKM